MEDLIGIIIFILFIMFRAMGDRKKGMKKEPVRPRTKPAVETRQPVRRQEPVPAAKAVREKPRPPKPLPEPVAPFRQFGEGESAYDNLAYIEGAGPQEREEFAESPIQALAIDQNVSAEPVLTAADIRKAVIWSEVLQKPRFRTRRRRNAG